MIRSNHIIHIHIISGISPPCPTRTWIIVILYVSMRLFRSYHTFIHSVTRKCLFSNFYILALCVCAVLIMFRCSAAPIWCTWFDGRATCIYTTNWSGDLNSIQQTLYSMKSACICAWIVIHTMTSKHWKEIEQQPKCIQVTSIEQWKNSLIMIFMVDVSGSALEQLKTLYI